MITESLIPVRLARRCWYTVLHLLTAEDALDLRNGATASHLAPHGFALVPSYTGERDAAGNWMYSTSSGWKLEPRRRAGCSCNFCRRFGD